MRGCQSVADKYHLAAGFFCVGHRQSEMTGRTLKHEATAMEVYKAWRWFWLILWGKQKHFHLIPLIARNDP
mgnify:FL=1